MRDFLQDALNNQYETSIRFIRRDGNVVEVPAVELAEYIKELQVSLANAEKDNMVKQNQLCEAETKIDLLLKG